MTTDFEFMGHQAIKPPASYAQKVAEALRNEIISGALQAGERLPTESAICQAFGVSRAVVREAISALKQDGYVVSFQGKGIFVLDRPIREAFELGDADLNDVEDLENILEFLIANEVAATALAAERRTPEDLRELAKVLDSMKAAVEEGRTGIAEDLAFHTLIMKASRNPYFISFTAFLEGQVRRLIRAARANSSQAGMSVMVQDEHVRIFDALVAGDGAAAGRAAEEHLRNAAHRLRTRCWGN